MAIQVICDGCGNRLDPKKDHSNRLSWFSHLEEDRAYVTHEGEAVSGRLNEYDVCQSCYNFVMGRAVENFKKLQKAKALKSV